MKSIFLTLFLILFSIVFSAAQGYEYDSIEGRRSTRGTFSIRRDVPHGFSLRRFCPTPQHQGEHKTCVSWAVSYAAYTILKGVQQNRKVEAFSSIFLAHHLHRHTNYDRGMPIIKALDTFRKYGTLKDAIYTRDFKPLPSPTQSKKAESYKITTFKNIYDYQKDQQHLPQLVETLKTCIGNNQPIIIGIEIDDTFKNNGVGIWNGFTTQTATKEHHAVCIIGYDMNKKAFEIMNSWGDSWSDKGFGWITYEAMKQHCLVAFVIER